MLFGRAEPSRAGLALAEEALETMRSGSSGAALRVRPPARPSQAPASSAGPRRADVRLHQSGRVRLISFFRPGARPLARQTNCKIQTSGSARQHAGSLLNRPARCFVSGQKNNSPKARRPTEIKTAGHLSLAQAADAAMNRGQLARRSVILRRPFARSLARSSSGARQVGAGEQVKCAQSWPAPQFEAAAAAAARALKWEELAVVSRPAARLSFAQNGA